MKHGTPEDLALAQEGLVGVAERTPLIPLDGFDHDVRIKAEHLQPIGAFKIRGAWTALTRLDPEVRARGVVTSSSGNHGYAVAWAAHRLGVPAVIVMPTSAPRIKQDNIQAVGGKVVLVGATRGPEQYAEAARLSAEEGLELVLPFNNLNVVSGQATCAAEILEDWPEVGHLAVPVGGGGLLAGCCLAVKLSGREIRVSGIEPEQVPKLSAAIEAGSPVELGGGTSLADGMLTRSIGSLTWPLIKPIISGAVSVSDVDIRAAMRWLADRDIRAEPSGATTVAALLAGKLPLHGPTALILSGGNVDPDRYAELVN